MYREPSRKVDEMAALVIDAALEVHKVLGPGFLESVYEDALCLELSLRNIFFERQKAVHVLYKGSAVGEGRIDILVGGELIVELKAVEELAPIHTAQVLSYLKATGFSLGLLVNFNVPLLKNDIKRVVLSS
ncbi:GxxExxY protein [Tichowtungia aerotolerans]|uniref:GxxExxY protein n=1 Tax=Tichowtungia aerotolerans TaxID=2697043 RepID=A0A6P1M9D2_9BACT|nr:GxxExxY protein [Tichowtungia aerotolerans]QHI69673.1 GxxExxY protein [Tichowtungia aerotolerans]